MTNAALDALAVQADPVGVIVELLTAAEPALDRAAVERAVYGVAGGRAKRRRLAQALLANPALLGDGRSPAPRVVGDLLIAIRTAGADTSRRRCGKPLRTLQRRGEDWYFGGYEPRRKPCTGCGAIRP